MCHFISEEIEEFLDFALFAKQNADFFRRRGGRKKLSLRFQWRVIRCLFGGRLGVLSNISFFYTTSAVCGPCKC